MKTENGDSVTGYVKYRCSPGDRFGKLSVTEDGGRDKYKFKLYRCMCDCGVETVVPASRLHKGITKSCGCFNRTGRWEARRAGSMRYDSDKPCPKGHVGERFVINGSCCTCVDEKRKARTEGDRVKENARARARRTANLEKARAKGRAQRAANPERRRASVAKWRKNNPDYGRQKRASDPQTRIADNLRCRLYMAIRNKSKAGSAVRDLGCPIDEFIKYIESLFLPSMSWENRRKWHLDHKRPLASFDLTDREQFLQACHWSNYQPLWAVDNLKKAARVHAA